MKRFILIFSFLVIGLNSFAGKFTIKSMNVKSIKVGNNRTCYIGSDFYDYEEIHWTSANEEMIVFDHDANKKRCFSKSLFENNKFRTAGDFYKKINTPATLSASAPVSYRIISPKYSHGEKRYALVIGNSNYIKENMLRAPIADASRISNVLSDIGFTVYLLMDARKSEMEKVIKDFKKAATSCDVALFYYEGHGQQVDGELYLIPIEATIDSPEDKYNCVVGPLIVRAMDETKANSKLIFIDACRSEGNYQMGANTIYSMDAPKDGVVMFSTLSGKYAYDGFDVASTHFARAFVNKIPTPNRNITEILSDIILDVSENTVNYSQQQIPTYSSSLTHRVILVNQSEGVRKITFNVTPNNAKLFFDNDSNNTYSIGQPLNFTPGSSYTYHIVADGYQEESESFVVSNSTPSVFNIKLKPMIEPVGLNYFTYKNQNGEKNSGAVSSCTKGEISYLYCNIVLTPNVPIKDTIWNRVLSPDGTVWSCSSCEPQKSDFTFGDVVDWKPKQQRIYAPGFGCDNASCWQVGRYTWQIWFHGQKIAEETFDILPKNELSSVSFAAKWGHDFLNTYGGTLYVDDVRKGYLYTKISWKETMESSSYFRCSFYSDGKFIKKYDGKIEKGESTIELKCGDRWSPGKYSCQVGDTLGNVWKTYSFTIKNGKQISTDISGLDFTKSPARQTITVQHSGDFSCSQNSDFKYRIKGDKLTVWPSYVEGYQVLSSSLYLTDKSNGSHCYIDLKCMPIKGWWSHLSNFYDDNGRLALSWGQAKMFAGQGFGAELSTMALRFGLFGISPVNFGVRSNYQFDFDVYYAPSVSFVMPVYSKYYSYALYCAAAPTIELYASPNSPFKKYWFMTELGFRWYYELDVGSVDLFVRYDGSFSAGLALDFNMDVRWL